ncbi:hypothetical protein [Haloarcula laminariae]|uniref:hypothetical protein n=1 Tax=Haloarcula laminariae TaxID=2961577 RepID=UPI0021C82397|nr:hypothetical protein [Halomicroarcula laminariae]
MSLLSWLAISFLLWLIAAFWFSINRKLSTGRLILAAFVVLFWPIPYDLIAGIIEFLFDITMGIISLLIGGILLAVGIPLAIVGWVISAAIVLVVGYFVLWMFLLFLAAMGFPDYFGWDI